MKLVLEISCSLFILSRIQTYKILMCRKILLLGEFLLRVQYIYNLNNLAHSSQGRVFAWWLSIPNALAVQWSYSVKLWVTDDRTSDKLICTHCCSPVWASANRTGLHFNPNSYKQMEVQLSIISLIFVIL